MARRRRVAHSLRVVALFRGINNGRAKRVAMADLRAVIEGLGYRDARTLLNSGNVFFTTTSAAAAKAAPRIEKAVAAAVGISSRVTLLSAAEVTAIVKANPLVDIADNPSRLFVTIFTEPSVRARIKPLQATTWDPDVLAIGRHAAYVWCPAGIHQSKLAKEIARLSGDSVTTRNWATIQKIEVLLDKTT